MPVLVPFLILVLLVACALIALKLAPREALERLQVGAGALLLVLGQYACWALALALVVDAVAVGAQARLQYQDGRPAPLEDWIGPPPWATGSMSRPSQVLCVALKRVALMGVLLALGVLFHRLAKMGVVPDDGEGGETPLVPPPLR